MREFGIRAMDYRPVESLKPAKRNPRTHSRKQIRQIADSITKFGFTNPALIDADGHIIAGHGRVAAAKLIGLDRVPVVPLGDLSAKERQAYALADNKLALNAGWDQDLLAVEFQELIDAGFELELTGFSLAEVDLLKNLCVWNKTNGGMGSFYRSKHELIFVYKHGTAPHVNSIGLGDTGRYRTNV